MGLKRIFRAIFKNLFCYIFSQRKYFTKRHFLKILFNAISTSVILIGIVAEIIFQ